MPKSDQLDVARPLREKPESREHILHSVGVIASVERLVVALVRARLVVCPVALLDGLSVWNASTSSTGRFDRSSSSTSGTLLP